MKTIRVAPDGELLDHVAEFVFEDRDRLRELFSGNIQGYTDSVAKLVQTLASSEKIVVANRPGVTSVTNVLKEHLQSAGRLEFSNFFQEEARAEYQKNADLWLTENWPLICADLENPELAAEAALTGFFHREFHYYWLQPDSAWDASWYLPEEASLVLPVAVMKRLLRAIDPLAQKNTIEIPEEQMRVWINRVATTHFRTFGEYWLHLGKETGDEYMPAFARSSLQFLDRKTQYGNIERLAMPFIGFAALKHVKERGNLVEQVVEWSEGSGKDIVEGLHRHQEIARTITSEEEKKRLFAEVEDCLGSNSSLHYQIFLNLVKFFTSTLRLDPDLEAERTLRSLFSKSYRWIFKISNPALQWEWQKRLKKLLE